MYRFNNRRVVPPQLGRVELMESLFRAIRKAERLFTKGNANGDAEGPNGEIAFNKFGNNPNIAIGTTETVWSGSNVYPWIPPAGLVLTITSAAGAADDGVQIRILYLDANFEDVRVTVTLNNAAPPTITATRVNRAYVIPGSAPLTGLCTMANGGTVYTEVTVAAQQTLQGFATVPAGHTVYITDVYATVGRNDEADLALFTQDATQVAGFRGRRQQRDYLGLPNGSHHFPIAPPDQWWAGMRIPEKTDIELCATAVTAAVRVSAGFQAIVVPGT